MLAQRAEDVVSFNRRDAGRLAVSAVVQIGIHHIPFTQRLLKLEPISMADCLLAIGLGRWPSWSFIVAVVASVLGTPALYLSGYVTLLATLAPAASQTGRVAQVGTIRELPIDNGIPH